VLPIAEILFGGLEADVPKIVGFDAKWTPDPERIVEIKSLRADGTTVPEIIRRVGLSKATVYRALGT
jgi:DNA invertase Pin-like site-specific DNA recombinase